MNKDKDLNQLDPAPENNLPTFEECRLRVENSEYIDDRVANGGYGDDGDSLLANELHKFIYEYDMTDPYKSAWFLHRLEKLVNFIKAESDLELRGCK